LRVRRSLPFVGLGVTAVLFILVATQLLAGYGSASLSHLFTYWLYDGVGEVTALTCLIRGLRHKEDRLAWILIGIGVAAWTIGDLYYTWVLQPSVRRRADRLEGWGMITVPAGLGLVCLLLLLWDHFSRQDTREAGPWDATAAMCWCRRCSSATHSWAPHDHGRRPRVGHYSRSRPRRLSSQAGARGR
jgi:hypothetical protein